METRLSIILPARNEADGLKRVLPELKRRYPQAEILVIDDGSSDDTAAVGREQGARVISHPYGMGNGAAVKTGIRRATGEILVLMDADGQHRPEDIERLLAKLDEGYEMVVGARDSGSQASIGRWFANTFYNGYASWMVGQRIKDLTSGFRAVRAERMREFIHMLPNGFSYPTTSTMAFFRSGYPVAYVPIKAEARLGKSHIRPLRDGIRFLLIMFRIGTLYSPLKIFLPFALLHFLIGAAYYAYTYSHYGRFTNMSALLLSSSVIIFLIGLIAEQITMLLYSRAD